MKRRTLLKSAAAAVATAALPRSVYAQGARKLTFLT